MKKVTLLLLTVLMFTLSVFVVEDTYAACSFSSTGTNKCSDFDKDNDGWIDSTKCSAAQTVTCENAAIIKKGGGDCVDNPASVIKDSAGNTIKAKDINPGAVDVPNNGVDEDCSGEDAGVGVKTTMDAQGVLDNIRNFLIWVVGGVSGIILIIGGIMYAMAAGDEQKTKKAQKAIIGAVVGLVVALLANVIIMVVSNSIVK
jgi:hypothetical protein